MSLITISPPSIHPAVQSRIVKYHLLSVPLHCLQIGDYLALYAALYQAHRQPRAGHNIQGIGELHAGWLPLSRGNCMHPPNTFESL